MHVDALVRLMPVPRVGKDDPCITNKMKMKPTQSTGFRGNQEHLIFWMWVTAISRKKKK
jgi:hypothetical protein